MTCEANLMFLILDEGITLHTKARRSLRKDGIYSNAIRSCLFTRFGLKNKTAQDQFWACLPVDFDTYKQVTIANGDRIRAADHQGQPEGDTDCRDATFVRVGNYLTPQTPSLNLIPPTQYSLLRDVYERIPSREPVFKGAEYFGQLKTILVTELPPGIVPAITQPKRVVLVAIDPRDTTNETSLDIPYYTEPSKPVAPRVVDINTVMCLVGRIKDRGQWAVIDRSGDLARADFVD